MVDVLGIELGKAGGRRVEDECRLVEGWKDGDWLAKPFDEGTEKLEKLVCCIWSVGRLLEDAASCIRWI